MVSAKIRLERMLRTYLKFDAETAFQFITPCNYQCDAREQANRRFRNWF